MIAERLVDMAVLPPYLGLVPAAALVRLLRLLGVVALYSYLSAS